MNSLRNPDRRDYTRLSRAEIAKNLALFFVGGLSFYLALLFLKHFL
jgi:hypothetical protein